MNDSQPSDKQSHRTEDVQRDCCSAARTCVDTAAAAAPADIDPICGMQVDPATTPHRVEHAGTEHYFCSAHCRQVFVDSDRQASAAR